MPSTLDEHIYYTRKEWKEQEYYIGVLNYVKQKNIKTMIDAGGCTGEVTKIFFDMIPTLEKCFIFEASYKNSEFIKNNLSKYNIEIVNKCLYYGADYVSLGLNYGDDNVGGYSVNYSNKHLIEENIATAKLEEISEDIDFIKIDIEGAEKNVIANSSKLKEIKFLEIEFHDELENTSLRKIFIETHLNNYKLISCNHNHVFLEKV